MTSDRPIPTYWYQHCKTDEEKMKFRQMLLGSSLVLNVLQDILDEQKRVLESSEYSEKDFTDANWSEKQAFRNGKKASLAFINSLIDPITG